VFDAVYKKQDTGKIKKKKEQKEHEEKKQKIRLAGLLHDIGHYPFSHTMEDAVEFYLKNSRRTMWGLVSLEDPRGSEGEFVSRPLKHETIGSKILERDPEIRGLLDAEGYNPIEISNLFIRKGESTSQLAGLISSDLDVDRLDYLLRDAYHTGLPYGSTDLEYILREITFDDSDPQQICISPKALRTVDHFLLCRYFNYSQIIFHKSVAGFEEVLKRVISHLIEKNILKYSEADILDKISDRTWYSYDDIFLMNLIRQESQNVDEDFKPLFNSILKRSPPKEIVKLEYIDGGTKTKFNQFCEKITDLNALIPDLATKFDLNQNHIFIWNNGGLKLTKIGALSQIITEYDEIKIPATTMRDQ
jgi:HD superfamily phosphohydrolase